MQKDCITRLNICRVVNQNPNFMNKTFTYMLPAIMEHLDAPVKSSYIRSAVLPEYRNHIFVVYEKENHIPKKSSSLIDKYTSDFNEQVYVYEIPKKYIPEFEKFKLGKYSELNYQYKKRIFNFHNVSNSESRLAKVLYKHSDLKSEIEDVLNCNIPNNQELSSIPDLKVETYPLNNKDIQYSKEVLKIHRNFFNPRPKAKRLPIKRVNTDFSMVVTRSGRIIGKHSKKEIVGLRMHKPSNIIVFVTK